MSSANLDTATTGREFRPLVSVIMIFYNAARYIAEAIDSVVAQTWPNWELLLIDDGSHDDSRAIAERYRQTISGQIRILEHRGHANCGMSASRNLGVAAARGDFVTFLDADDVYLPTRLARHVELLGQHPEVGAVQGCLEYWRSWPADPAARRPDVAERPPPVALRAPVYPPELLLLMLDAHGATAPGICSLTVRLTLLQATGGSDEGFRAHYEDQVLFAKLYLSTSVLVTDERLARYRQHAESATGRVTDAGQVAQHRWEVGRIAFLSWLESWLTAKEIEDELVWKRLRSAQRSASEVTRRSLPRQLLAALRRLTEAVLPETISTRLVDWWGRRKLARSARKTARAHARITRELAGGGVRVPDDTSHHRGT